MSDSSKLAQEMRELAATRFGATTYHQWHEVWEGLDKQFDTLLAPLREECDELRAQMNRINLRHGETLKSLVEMNIELKTELKNDNEMIESLVKEVEEEERNVYELSSERDELSFKADGLQELLSETCEKEERFRKERDELRDSISCAETERDWAQAERNDLRAEVMVLKECISDHECGNKLLKGMIETLAQKHDELEEETQELQGGHDVVATILTPLLEGVDKVRFSIKSVIGSQELALDQKLEAFDERDDALAEVERLQKSIDFNDHLRKASRIVDAWPDWKKSVLIFPGESPYPEEVEAALLEFRAKDQAEIELLMGEVAYLKNELDIKGEENQKAVYTVRNKHLKAERDQLRDALKAKRAWESDTIKVVRVQSNSIIELSQQLYRFGRHRKDCNYVLRTHLKLGTKDCNCGWSEIEEESKDGSS